MILNIQQISSHSDNFINNYYGVESVRFLQALNLNGWTVSIFKRNYLKGHVAVAPGTQINSEFGSVGLMDGLDDLRGLLQPG